MTIWKILLCALVIIVGIACRVRGHAITCDTACAQTEEDRLAREVEDPTAILTQLQIQDLYTPRNFRTSAQTNTIQIRPIVPIEAFPWFPFQQIVRPTFKVQTLAISSSSSTITEFSDMELIDLFVANWPNPKDTGFGWGVGPTFVFPHAWPWLVRKIVRLDVEGQLAPQQFDHDSDQPWLRARLEGLGVTTQPMGDGRVDGLSAILKDHADVHRPVWRDTAVP